MPIREVEWCEWEELINTRFIPLVENRDRYLILWGGRGSSKSDFAAKKLIYRCLLEPYFRYLLIKQEYNSIKDSSYQTIKDIVEDLGLHMLFQFKTSPLEIICWNGNKFVARGLDKATRLKSMRDYTGAWWEEDIPSEKDFITITTSIRTQKAEYLQEIFTINPEVNGDYQEHWFYKRFFESHHPEVNFSSITIIEIEINKIKKLVEMTFTSHHSTYEDNQWIPDEFIAFLEELKVKNEYYYTIYCLGKWGNKQTGGLFYKLFTHGRNVIKNKVDPQTRLPELYNEKIPLHITYDFNRHPYVTICVHQLTGKRAIQIDEFCLPSPDNTTKRASEAFKHRYRGHQGGLFVYGDPAGKAEDTRQEDGENDFTIIKAALKDMRPTMRQQESAPPVKTRGDFINDVFLLNYEGLEFLIGDNCVNSVADYQNLLEASDGTKQKTKVKNPETNVTYEKWGHTSDANDYLYCRAYISEFEKYKRGGKKVPISTGKTVNQNTY